MDQLLGVFSFVKYSQEAETWTWEIFVNAVVSQFEPTETRVRQ